MVYTGSPCRSQFLVYRIIKSLLGALLGGVYFYLATQPELNIQTLITRLLRPDIPDVLKWHAETNELMSYLTAQCVELNSPIIQLFVRPFSKPWIIMTDFRES